MRRRDVLAAVGTATATALAGCSDSTPDVERVAVASIPAFSAAANDEDIASKWLAEEFRARTETQVDWNTPPGALSAYVARRLQGRPLGADVFLGVTPVSLAAARSHVDDLFAEPNTDLAERATGDAGFDPLGHVAPVTTSNVALVYDSTTLSAPETFDKLLTAEYASDLALADPRTDDVGRLFYLWSVRQFGLDEARRRWKRVLEAGAHLYETTAAAFAAYRAGVVPMLVAPATITLFAGRHHLPMEKYKVRFLDGAAYRHVTGVGRFTGAENPANASEFASFLYDPEVQGRLAVLTGTLPVTEDANLPEDFDDYVHHPDATVAYDYDELAANLGTWMDAWRAVATAE